MTMPPSPPTAEALPGIIFRPLHKRAFGMATGLVMGLAVFLLTAAYLVHPPSVDVDLLLLREYFAGYRLSWAGACIGGAWGGFVGFIAGWFLAFSRNILVGILVVVVRSRAQLAEARDILDHI